jgi:Domain of Unknown Function with PDB structure (DUF3857)/Transglutaminase-like superfamily
MLKVIIIFLLLLSNFTFTVCQDFGEISDEVLQMTSFDKDPEADAVILFDKAQLRITGQFDLEVIRHVRIKILTEAGKENANVEIYYWHEDDLDILDASSFNSEGKEVELDSDDIFVEEKGNVYKIVFAIPGAEIGSVIEYKYRRYSDYISSLEPWYFQNTSYTLLSEYSVMVPKEFTYTRLSRNLAMFNITENVESVRNPEDFNKALTQFTWTGRNLPGIKEEPYMDNLYDEYASMLFILSSYKSRTQYRVFAESWDDVAERLSRIYDDMIDQGGETEVVAETIVSSEPDDLSKAKKLYDFVRTEIKTSEHKTIFGDSFKEPNEVLQDKEGSSSDKNMLLINLLNQAGLNAKPVLISTRKNGVVVPDFCKANQFNRMICLLRIDNKSYYLYTGVKANPFGYLTPATNVGIGLLIEGDKGTIINLKPIKPTNKLNIETVSTINSEGIITAKSKFTYIGCTALEERMNIEDEDIEEYVETLLDNLYAEAVLDTFYYTGLDSINNPLILNIRYTLPDYIDETEELIYFTPPLFTGIDENPFVRQKRYFPVSYNYNVRKSEKFKMIFSNKFAVNEVPLRRKASINNYSFSEIFFKGKNYVECIRTTNLKRRVIHYQYYQGLKALYDEMVSADQEQIVLSKVNHNSEVGFETNTDEK